MRDGIQLYKQGKYQEALTSFLNTDVKPEEHALLSYHLGLCYARLGRYDESLLYLEQVVTSEMGFAHVYQCRLLVGYIYAETERTRMAAWEFMRLLRDGFESAKVHGALAHVLYLERNLMESIDQLERALKLEPDNPNALNSMGFVLAESENRLGQALLCCQKAVKLRPESAMYLDSLGWVYHKMGRRKEATDVLRRALLMSPNKKIIKDHLQKVVRLNA